MSTKQQYWNEFMFMLHLIAGSMATGVCIAALAVGHKFTNNDTAWILYISTTYLDLQAIRFYIATKQLRKDSNEQTNNQS